MLRGETFKSLYMSRQCYHNECMIAIISGENSIQWALSVPLTPHHGIMQRVESCSRQGKWERGGRWEALQCYPRLLRCFYVQLILGDSVYFFCVLAPSVGWLEMNKTRHEMYTEDPPSNVLDILFLLLPYSCSLFISLRLFCALSPSLPVLYSIKSIQLMRCSPLRLPTCHALLSSLR